ncbi:MAG: DUF6982 domain-containing protein [Planctomycetota bacterium]
MARKTNRLAAPARGIVHCPQRDRHFEKRQREADDVQEQKIVARFRDGRIAKGHTTNFSPEAAAFLLRPADGGPPERVPLDALKAVFFVRAFAGDPERKDKEYFVPGQPYQGRRVQVQFVDGEVMLGYTANYHPSMRGFFIFPADPDANTIKAYAVASNVRQVRLL